MYHKYILCTLQNTLKKIKILKCHKISQIFFLYPKVLCFISLQFQASHFGDNWYSLQFLNFELLTFWARKFFSLWGCCSVHHKMFRSIPGFLLDPSGNPSLWYLPPDIANLRTISHHSVFIHVITSMQNLFLLLFPWIRNHSTHSLGRRYYFLALGVQNLISCLRGTDCPLVRTSNWVKTAFQNENQAKQS